MIDLVAFWAEDELWALTREEDGSNAGRNVVRRAGRLVKRFYVWQEAVDYLNDECLRASIAAATTSLSVAKKSRAKKRPGVITEADIEAAIEAAKTPKGGWTAAQFKAWGISYPPSKGWKQHLLERGTAA